MPALTRHAYGRGTAYYQAFRDTGEFFDRVIGEILDSLSIASPLGISLPDGMTVHERTDGENRYFFIENHSGKPASVTLPRALFDLELGEAVETLAFESYDVRILKA